MLVSGEAAGGTSSRLVYSRSEGATTCPDERALRAAVAERLGYDPFVGYAPTTVVAEVFREGAKLRARARLVDGWGISHGVRELAADQARVYWANAYIGGTVVACARAGCQGAPSVVASGQHRPTRVAVDERNAYWLDPADEFSKGEIMECPLAGCGPSPKRLASGQETSQQSYVALDSEHVYWSNSGAFVNPPPGPSTSGPYQDGDIRGVSK